MKLLLTLSLLSTFVQASLAWMAEPVKLFGHAKLCPRDLVPPNMTMSSALTLICAANVSQAWSSYSDVDQRAPILIQLPSQEAESIDRCHANYSNVSIRKESTILKCDQANVATLKGQTLVVGLSPGAPGALDALPDLTTHTGGVGAEIEAIYFLAQMLNFSIRFKTIDDGNWGALVNGSWNGGIKLIMDKSIDLAIGYFGISYERAQVVDFTIPVQEEYIGIKTHKPRPTITWRSIFKPFDPYVWLFTILALGGMSLFLALMSRRNGLGLYVLSAAQPLLKQGLSLHSFTPRARGSLILWILCTSVISMAYEGSLISSLTAPEQPKLIDTFEDILDSDKHIVFYQSTHQFALFKNSDQDLFQRVYRRVLSQGLDRSLLHDIELAFPKHQHWALIMAKRYMERELLLYPQSQRVLDLFHIGSAGEFRNNVGFPVRKGFKFTDDLSRGILRLTEAGLFQKWTDDAMNKARALAKANLTTYHLVALPSTLKDQLLLARAPVQLSLVHLKVPFILLALGCLSALLAFGLEVVFI